jgi:hypothetical protein
VVAVLLTGDFLKILPCTHKTLPWLGAFARFPVLLIRSLRL